MVFHQKENEEQGAGDEAASGRALHVRRNVRPRKILKNRKVLSVLCILLAAVLSFVVLPKMYKQQADVTMVVSVTETIKKGEIIRGNKLTEKEVGAYGLPKDCMRHVGTVEKKVAKVDMLAGDYVTMDKIGDFMADPVIETIVKQGKQLTTVSLQSNAAGMAAHLQKGDRVNVGVAREMEGGMYVVFDPELQGLEIYDMENANAVSVADIKSTKGYDVADAVPKTVTFVTTQQQSAKLLDAEYNGKLHLSLAKR